MNMHLDKKVITSAAIASAAVATAVFGTLAIVRKKRAGDQRKSEDATEAELKSNIGPGEVNPYADTPADSAKHG